MRAGTIGIAGAAALGRAFVLSRALRKVGEAIDEAFGDVPALPAEAVSRSAGTIGGGRSEAKADRLDTHTGGTHTCRPGAV